MNWLVGFFLRNFNGVDNAIQLVASFDHHAKLARGDLGDFEELFLVPRNRHIRHAQPLGRQRRVLLRFIRYGLGKVLGTTIGLRHAKAGIGLVVAPFQRGLVHRLWCEWVHVGSLNRTVLLGGELCNGNGHDDGNKSPSLSNLSLARVKELRVATVEERWRCEKDEDKVQAFVGDSNTSMSKELTGDLKEEVGRAIDLGEEGYG